MRRRKDDEYQIFNGGGVGYNEDALKKLVQGQYQGRQERYRSAQDQINQSRELPKLQGMVLDSTPVDFQSSFGRQRTPVDTVGARKSYERRINHKTQDVESQNLRNRGYEGSFRDFNMPDLNAGLGTEDANEMLRLDVDLEAYKRRKEHEEAKKTGSKYKQWRTENAIKSNNDEAIFGLENRQKYIDKYGAPMEEVLENYARFKEEAERKQAEAHPYRTSIEDVGSAFERGIEAATERFANWVAPDTWFSELASDDLAAGKHHAVEKKRDYIRKSQNLTEKQKNTAKNIYNISDILGSSVEGGVLSGGGAVVNPETGNVLSWQPSKWVRPVVEGVTNFGHGGTQEYNNLRERGVDEETAQKMANYSGLIQGGAAAATAGLGGAVDPSLSLGEKLGVSFATGSGIGGARQGANELAEKFVLGDQSTFELTKQAYIARGLSEKEAEQKAWNDVAKRTGLAAVVNGLVSAGTTATTQGIVNAASKANIPNDYSDLNSVWSWEGQPALTQNNNAVPSLTGPTEEIPSNAITGAELPALTGPQFAYPMTGTQGTISLPGTNGVISDLPSLAAQSAPNVTKYAAERAAQPPRIVQKLEGDALAQAQKKITDNNRTITTLEQRKEAILNDKSNYRAGKLKKAVEKDIKAIDREISTIKNDNRLTNREIKGTPTPIKELMEPAEYNAIFSEKTGVYKDLNYAVKFAGDTDQAKALRKDAKALLNNFVKTADIEYLKGFYNKVNELDTLAKATKADYKTSGGLTYRYDDYFGVNPAEPDNPYLMETIMGSGAMGGISNAHKRAGTWPGRQNAPVTAPSAPENASVISIKDYRENKAIDPGKMTPEDLEELEYSLLDKMENTDSIDELRKLREKADKAELYGVGDEILEKINSLKERFKYQTGDRVKYDLITSDGYKQYKGVIREMHPDHAVIDIEGMDEPVSLDLEDMAIMLQPDEAPEPSDGGFQNMNRLFEQMNANKEASAELPVVAMQTTPDVDEYMAQNNIIPTLEELMPVSEEAYDPALDPEMRANYLDPMKEEWNQEASDYLTDNEPNVKSEAPDNGYWLRILGDDEYLMQEAQRNNFDPTELRQMAAKYMGVDLPETTGNVPPSDNGPATNGPRNTKTSQTYTNTGRRGEGWSKEQYDQYTDKSQFQYENVDEEESVRRAIDMRTKEGREAFKERMMKAKKASGAEIDGMMMEWRELGAEARALQKAGQDASAVMKESIRVFRKIQELSTENAQGLQALAKWSRNTPEGMLARAEHIANGRINSDGTEKSAAQKTLEKISKSRKKFKFDDSFIHKFLDEAEEVLQLPSESRLANVKMAKLGKMVNEQIPVSFGEKLTTFLMDNMLGNFRTLIARNAGGNVGLNAMEQLFQRPLAAGIDSIVSRKTGVRTQAGLSKEGLVEYLQGFAKGIRDEVDDFKRDVHTARSGENTLENAIRANRHVFKSRFMDFGDKLVRTGLSVGDRPFYEAVYNQTLGDYYRLRNAGKMGSDIQNMGADDFEMFAKAAAQMNALGAVYQKDSALSNALMGIKNSVGELSRGLVGADILSQFSMPFVKTPANVVDVAIDYSPLGMVRNAIRTGKEIHNDEFDQNRFANETSRNILGTAGMAAAAGATAAGVLGKGYSDDKDEKQAQKDSGMQEYALNLPGGHQMDIGWSPVTGSNAVAAAAFMDEYQKDPDHPVSSAIKGAQAGGKALLDQAVFQGMQRLFGGDSYNSEYGIVGNIGETIKSGFGQGIPSLVRQTAQVIDPYKRDLANSNKDWEFMGMNNYDINSLINNVPVLRQTLLAPAVDNSGNLIKENQGRNVVSKVFEDMILPGKISKVDYSKLNEEAARLKEETTSRDAYMPKVSRQYLDTEEHALTNKEWSDYEQKYYGEMTSAGNKIINSDAYKNADAETQLNTLKYTYDAIKTANQSVYNGKEVKGAAKEYVDAGGGEDGVNAVVNYYTDKIKADKLNMTVNNYRKQEKEYKGGAVKYAEDKKKADALGITVDTYNKKQSESPNGAVQYANQKQEALDLGMVKKDGTPNTEHYNKVIKNAKGQADRFKREFPALKEFNLGDAADYVYANAINQPKAPSLSDFTKTYQEMNTNKADKLTQKEVLDYINTYQFSDDPDEDLAIATDLWNTYQDGTWKKTVYLKPDGTYGMH